MAPSLSVECSALVSYPLPFFDKGSTHWYNVPALLPLRDPDVTYQPSRGVFDMANGLGTGDSPRGDYRFAVAAELATTVLEDTGPHG